MGELAQGVAERLTEIANNPRELARLAEQGASLDDLAAIFGVPAQAIEAQHRPLLAKSWALHRMRIRKGFLLAAERGDVPALEFLARAHLVGQPWAQARLRESTNQAANEAASE